MKERIEIRIEAEDKKILVKTARELGISLSDLVRMYIKEKIKAK